MLILAIRLLMDAIIAEQIAINGVLHGMKDCHASKGVPQPTEPIRSIRGEVRGTAVPAPEYKTYTPKPAEKVNALAPVETTNTSPNIETYVPVPQTTYQEPALIRTPDIEIPQPKQEKRNFILRFFNWLF